MQRLRAAPHPTPRPEFRQAARERILAAARNTPRVASGPPRLLWSSPRLAHVARGLAAGLALTAVVIGGAASASASSMPGEMLYPTKLAVEQVQLAVVADEVRRTELRLAFAERRLDEIESAARAGNYDRVADLLQRYHEEMNVVVTAGRQAPAELEDALARHATRSTAIAEEALGDAPPRLAAELRAATQTLTRAMSGAPALQVGHTAPADSPAADPQPSPSATPRPADDDRARPSPTSRYAVRDLDVARAPTGHPLVVDTASTVDVARTKNVVHTRGDVSRTDRTLVTDHTPVTDRTLVTDRALVTTDRPPVTDRTLIKDQRPRAQSEQLRERKEQAEQSARDVRERALASAFSAAPSLASTQGQAREAGRDAASPAAAKEKAPAIRPVADSPAPREVEKASPTPPAPAAAGEKARRAAEAATRELREREPEREPEPQREPVLEKDKAAAPASSAHDRLPRTAVVPRAGGK